MEKLLKNVAVIIGMPRAGTTWLYENLKNHPDIGVSDHKEINRYLLDKSDQQYLDYFPQANKRFNLDVSPLYFFDQHALTEISQKHEKVILVVRNQDEWIKSLNSQIGKYGGNVEEFIRTQKYIFPVTGGATISFDYATYQQDTYIEEIINIFGGRLLVLDFAMIDAAPIEALNTIEKYLGIRNYFAAGNCDLGKINASQQPISRLYSLLFRLNILHRLIPLMLAVLPKSAIHWLRKRFVYGRK